MIPHRARISLLRKICDLHGANYDQKPVTAICSGPGVNLVIKRLLCQSSTSCKSTHCSATRIASSSSAQLMIVRLADT